MKRRFFLPLLFAGGMALGAFLPACGNKDAREDPPQDYSGADAAFHHTRTILSFGPRPPQSAALQKARAYVMDELARHGWQAVPQTVSAKVPGGRQITFTNVVSRFGAADESDLWKRPMEGLLGAHLDSKFYPNRKFLGADDAASAVGVILELARQLKDSPALASRLELVFFDGEEAFAESISSNDGLYGSKAYAHRWRTSPQRPRFGIVLDMVGHKNLKIRYPSDTPTRLEAALLAAAEAEGEAKRYQKGPNPIIDDHVPLNNAGIPTIDIIGDFTQFGWWHTDADNIRIISKESLAITLRVTRRMLEELLEEKSAE